MLLNLHAAAQCCAGQTKAVAFASTAAFRLASTLGQLLVGALSKQSATDHLSWSSPSFQESVFLVDILLTDSRCRLLGRKHASYLASVLIGLEEWLRMASASEQTCPTSPHQHLQLCWIGHTS